MTLFFNAAGLTSGEIDVRWCCNAALCVAGSEAEVVGFPTAQTRHVAGVVLSDAQSAEFSTDDGRQ